MTSYLKDASWIWVEKERGAVNDYAVFRLVIPETRKPPSRPCRINVSASNTYLLYVNGKFLARGPVRSWGGHIGVDSHNIKRHLLEGTNVISAIVHYHGAVEPPDDDNGFSRPGFLVQGDIDGVPLSTGVACWECFRPTCWNRKSARISDNYGYNEDVAMKSYHPEKWRTGMARSEWRKASIITDGGLNRPCVDMRSIPYLTEKFVKAPALVAIGVCANSLRTHDDGTQFASLMAEDRHLPIEDKSFQVTGKPWSVKFQPGIAPYLIVDAGRIVSGVLDLDITSAADVETHIGYDQVLYAGGNPVIGLRDRHPITPTSNTDLVLKADHGGNQNAVDRLFLKKGNNNWAGMFNVRGFRYAKIRFSRLTSPLLVKSVRIREITYPVRNTAKFKCDDAMLNRIWRAARLTTRLNMYDTFIDCATRERMQYGNQAYQQSLYAHYFFNETRLWRQFLYMFPQGAREDGAIQSGGPWPWNQIIPAYQLFWIESIREYAIRTGRNDVCRELSRNIVNALRWYEQFENETGMLVITEVFDRVTPNVLWNFFDWQRDDDGQLKGAGAAMALNCLYARSLKTAAWILTGTNRDAAAAFANKSEKLRKILAEAFKRGEPGTDVEHAIVHATLAGIISGKMKMVAANAIVGKLRSDVEHMFLTLQALIKEGHHKAALCVIKKTFGEMIDDGSSTIYEAIEAKRKPSRSLCQGSGGSAGYFIPEIIESIEK